MFKPVLAVSLLLILSACGEIKNLVSPPRPLTVAPVAPLQLKPGQPQKIALTITLAEDGTPVSGMRIVNPAPELVTASLADGTVTLQASADALPQGYIPITVEIEAGANIQRVRIPVGIGDLIEREYERFNALRAQAKLSAVAFDAEASMNCWMHGRYRALNNSRGHNEDPKLPYASPEGLACASSSNLSTSYEPLETLESITPFSDGLFSIPFHALGMLRPGQQTVGIGGFATHQNEYPSYVKVAGGITSNGNATGANGSLSFPGNGATTDLSRYSGGEWPNPLTACPGLDARQVGLPIIAATLQAGETTATEATLTVNGLNVPVCAYGSTQYVNTTDAPGNYVSGPVSAQDMGRRILKSSGAVFVIPGQPLLPSSTYQVSVKINGQPMQWSFKTASSMKAQMLGPSVNRQFD